ncbi:MAG TPA: glutathione S-transferase N-terminal domain-containing protein [Azospirillum sp.]|nr:glutathione S-transferase N-terminal domain-containing protein [Azospirillum sp.]
MLTLYYSPGACSLASHVTLEETGAPFEAHRVTLAKGEQHTPEYRAINPRARVPALRIDGGDVLTENPAILTYLARRFPEAKLLPADPLAEARCLSMMAFLSSSVHPAFAHIFRPERFADDASAHPAIKETGRRVFFDHLKEIDGLLAGKEWAQGSFTVCDPYLLVFYWWGMRIELPVAELPNYTAHKQRMLARPAVRRAIEREGIPLA